MSDGRANIKIAKKSTRVKTEGFVVGKQVTENRIELLFQSITKNGELKAGASKGVISLSDDGKLLLNFDWNWLNGDQSGGTSSYVELTA